jgi:preprotein translocase subunit SecB
MYAEPEEANRTTVVSRPKAFPAGVEISGISLRGLQYVEDITTDTLSEEWPTPGILALSGVLVPQSAHTVEFLIQMRVTGRGKNEAFGVFVSISALFTRQPIIEARPFVEFLNRQGAPILFPYVREVVANITSRSANDSLIMAPMILEPLLDDKTIDEVIRNLEELASATALNGEATAATN